MFRALGIVAAVYTALALSSCTSGNYPNLGAIYNRAAGYHNYNRNPVIVIPGVLGSKLVNSRSGRTVWGAFAGGFPNPNKPRGARTAALPMREGAALADLKDSIIPNGALDSLSANLLILPVRLNAYYNLLRILGVGGYRDEDLGRAGLVNYGKEHFTCFQFAYDWRRDNVENARLLDEFINKKRRYVQAELKKRFGIRNADVKFDIIAHSMGGLIARYYLMYGSADLPGDGSSPKVTWAGSRHVEKLIMIGTPNAGSIRALLQLIKGFSLGPFIPKYQPAVLGTMPSIYEVLPQPEDGWVILADDDEGKPLDVFDPDIWEKMKWGLASPNQDKVLKMLLPDVHDRTVRRRIALDHQRKCLIRARRFREAVNARVPYPKGLFFYLFAGDAIQTDAAVAVNSKEGTIKVVRKAPGDGTVLRSSALMDERLGKGWSPRLVSPIEWTNTIFLFTDHLGMTKDPTFTDNILYLLLEQPKYTE